MSDDGNYIESLFDVIDGKVKFKDLGKKKRGRKAGYQHSEETRKKIADKMRGRVKDPETRNKISKSLLGREKPFETRQKISRSKIKNSDNSVARDMLEQYSGISRERDIPTSTYDFFSGSEQEQIEACEWIKENFDRINEDQGGHDKQGVRTFRWEADLNADLKKEELDLDEIGFIIETCWGK